MIWIKARTTRQELILFKDSFFWILILFASILSIFLSSVTVSADSVTTAAGQQSIKTPAAPTTGQDPAQDQQDSSLDSWLPDATLQSIALAATGKTADTITVADCSNVTISISTAQFLSIANTKGLENFKSILIDADTSKVKAGEWQQNPIAWQRWLGTDFEDRISLTLGGDLRAIFSNGGGIQFESLNGLKSVAIAAGSFWRSDADIHLGPDKYQHFQISTANLGIPDLDNYWQAAGGSLADFGNHHAIYTAQATTDQQGIDFSFNSSHLAYRDLVADSGPSSLSLPIQIQNFNGSFNLLANLYFSDQAEQALPVTVQYLDSKGRTIADSVTIQGEIGDSYAAQKKDIKGYYLSEVKGNLRGQLTSHGQLVVFVYEKIAAGTTVPKAASSSRSQSNSQPSSGKNKQNTEKKSSAKATSTSGSNTGKVSGKDFSSRYLPSILSSDSSSIPLLLSNKSHKNSLSVIEQVFQMVIETAGLIIVIAAAAFVYSRIKKRRD